MLFQPTNITPDEVNGSGCVDLNDDLVISWQVNGDSAMVAYKITIYANTSESTEFYTTGRVVLDEPHWRKDAQGSDMEWPNTVLAKYIYLD